MLQIVSGLVVIIWVASDYIGLVLSEGSKAALGAFVAYSVIQSKRDKEWRQLEVEADELDRLKELVASLEQASPGSKEAVQARAKLVALALKAQEDRRNTGDE